MTEPRLFVDLHVHSTASDGTLSPAALVDTARSRNVGILAITDHDTTDGVPEGSDAARDAGVRLIPGVELSVDLERDGFTAHLLGYFPATPPGRLTDPDTEFGRAVAYVRNGRSARNPRILEKLRVLGMRIDMAEVEAIAGGEVIGRPHIAQAMVSAGYVGDSREAFARFLARGMPAYADRDRLPVSRTIRVIRDAGGLPVLAHPGYIGMDATALESLVSELAAIGLSGIEAHYPGHDAATTGTLTLLAGRMGMVTTGGTDFHGWSPESPPLGGSPDGFHVEASMIEGFLALCDRIAETEAARWRS